MSVYHTKALASSPHSTWLARGLLEARIECHSWQEESDGTLTATHDVLLASASEAPLMHTIRVYEPVIGEPHGEHIATETHLVCGSQYYRHSCNHPAAALHVTAIWHLHAAIANLDMRQVMYGYTARRAAVIVAQQTAIAQHTDALRVLGFTYREESQ